ncbi:DUF1552 domain-containing protein [Crateriforma spongiae]|uniref:DUF1552 domain-containing protein n=1 Tax=Crateriforma spongiae TaxID=2724528 RepID=UPI0014457701|nr:DUF1552 domain-containing protein [Crateriforma spongiae]
MNLNTAKIVSSRIRSLLHRRTVLRGSGVAMSLPWLSAMAGSFADDMESAAPRRMVTTTLGLGLVDGNLNPTQTGRDYAASPYLKSLDDLRDRFTVISGTSHPGVSGGHRAEASILTARPMGTTGQVRNTISLDQHVAQQFSGQTRYESLVLATSGTGSPCYTRHGAMIPPETSPSRLYEKLFVDESDAQRKRQAQKVLQSRSIMDLVGDDAKALQRELGVADRDRLDAYFTSVRELEKQMQTNQQWALQPKPSVDVPRPVDVADPNDLIQRFDVMCGMIKLALETDSTRVISLHLPAGGGVVPIDGVDQGYHSLSHHGRDEEKLTQLQRVETAIVRQWGQFMRDLAASEDSGTSLLDQTTLLMTSNLGNASNHDNRNMPVLLGGGKFRHGTHLGFDRKNNYPLPNLFVSILQQMGVPADQFATSTGTMTGLDFKVG